MDFRIHVQQLDQDERTEGDGDDVGEWVVEEDDCAKHDDGALEDGLEHPDEEGFCVERTTELKSFVEGRKFHNRIYVDILIKHQWKHRERCVDCSISQHQIPIINRYRNEEKDQREDCLNHSDNQPPVNNKLRECCWPFVTQSAMPQQQPPQKRELIYREVAG